MSKIPTEAWKRYPFWTERPHKGHYREYPPPPQPPCILQCVLSSLQRVTSKRLVFSFIIILLLFCKKKKNRFQFLPDRIHLTSQVVCYDNLVFTDVVAGWPGSVQDSRVLRNSELWNTSTSMFPGDTHLLGDEGYPLLRYLNKQSVATIVNLTAGINSNFASYWFP